MTTTATAPRRARRGAFALAAAVATAAACGAALPLPAAHAASGAAPSATLPLTDGTLEWGVKKGFRSYVTGPIAHGRILVADGARQAADNGPFTFPGGTGTYDTQAHAVNLGVRGTVRFTGHNGQLDLAFTHVKVTTKGTAGTIVADVVSSGHVSDDVPLASLDLSGITPGGGPGGAVTYANIPAKLTAEGAKAFNDMYQAGQELDPATLSVTPGTATPTPSATPTAKPTPTPTATPTAKPTPTPTPTGKPTPAAPPRAASGRITDGNLDWGVKKRFRDYVTGPIAKGAVTVSDGAAKNGDGYRFQRGTGSYDATAQTLDARFSGAVRFTGHAGALDLKLADLAVKANGTKGTLYADVTSKDRETGKVTESNDVPLADLKLPQGGLTAKGDVVSLTAVPATLTARGATAFAGFYEQGEALDPVTAAVSLKKGAPLPATGTGIDTDGGSAPAPAAATTGGGATGGGAVTGGSGALATTGSDLPSGALAGAAAALVTAGAAVTYATRRRLSGTDRRA
ncbi:HtaA domain-containing protein [Streptomyces sp. B1866]|uniref:HtaA domain-containing protein n=1 Tax=Streptomyces sp. B1866 TaxID=3075431 RepID=UPI0028928104|nr:HtaA domain-containing protein [Streptomyces sp. B1866]MDT3400430.1 HtaA domain-containing protein [Streptomyces sp. B1866]